MKKIVHTIKSVSKKSYNSFATQIAHEWLESKGYKVKSFPDNFVCNVIGYKGDARVGYLVTASEEELIFPRWRKLVSGISDKHKLEVVRQVKSEFDDRIRALNLTTFENIFVLIHPHRTCLYKSNHNKSFDCNEVDPELKVYIAPESEIVVVQALHKTPDDALDDAVLRLVNDYKIITAGFSDLQKS